ncbi:MAG: riboflavin synthase [Deltaproteobacteria bacterium]|jgi:riboflavin synthase|nr:riboflavin synthase [Deltaproteobacteria bacterium]
MFTGLVLGQGKITSRRKGDSEAELVVEPLFSWDGPLVVGESIAVSGVCLTVTSIKGDSFSAYASLETLKLSTLGEQDSVNLERALKLTDRLGGHLVSGHVDGLGRLVTSTPMGKSLVCRFSYPDDLGPFIAPKGSITIDGVSLTVNEVGKHWFNVNLIPQTSTVTTLSTKKRNQAVNLEVDILARYVKRLMEGKNKSGSFTIEELIDKGF